MAHEPFDGLRRVPYVVMVAKGALVGAEALFERPGGIVGRYHSLLVGSVHPLASTGFTPEPAFAAHFSIPVVRGSLTLLPCLV